MEFLQAKLPDIPQREYLLSSKWFVLYAEYAPALVEIFSGEDIDPLFSFGDGRATPIRHGEKDGHRRILVTYEVPEDDKVIPPFKSYAARKFFVDINYAPDFNQAAADAEDIARSVLGGLVPERLRQGWFIPKQPYQKKFHYIVYAIPSGAVSLKSVWSTLKPAGVKSFMPSLILAKKLLAENTRLPTTGIIGDLIPAGRSTQLQPSNEFKRWDVYNEFGKLVTGEKLPPLIRGIGPVLKLLDSHVPDGETARVQVARDTLSVYLSIGESEPIAFSRLDMSTLKESFALSNAFLDQDMIFLTPTDSKHYKLVSLFGWEDAEYVPIGYHAAVCDSKVGTDLKDMFWYLLLRRPQAMLTWTRRRKPLDPVPSKLADVVHMLPRNPDYSRDSREKFEKKKDLESWLTSNGYEWQGGKIGYDMGFRDLIMQRVDVISKTDSE